MTDNNFLDIDPIETQEWIDAFNSVVQEETPERAGFLLKKLVERAAQEGVTLPFTTPYVNTIPVASQEPYPGDEELEDKISALIRWNAMGMVVRGGQHSSELGGHIASYASAATIYEVGFNHFFHAPNNFYNIPTGATENGFHFLNYFSITANRSI